MDIIQKLTEELQVKKWQVEAAVKLIDVPLGKHLCAGKRFAHQKKSCRIAVQSVAH